MSGGSVYRDGCSDEKQIRPLRVVRVWTVKPDLDGLPDVDSHVAKAGGLRRGVKLDL